MDFDILYFNLTNPPILFFVLGIIAKLVKSDLEIPSTSSKFISLYLLFSIGFKGGQELAHSGITTEVLQTVFFGFGISIIIPLYAFWILKWKLGAFNAGAIAAAYGSVSVVTFVAASSFLEIYSIPFGGHLVAIMALMEAPAIIIGVLLVRWFDKENNRSQGIRHVVRHSLTNGSVMLLLGSLAIGYIVDVKQAEGIRPFTTDIFKGFLAIFLLEMGMLAAAKLSVFRKYGWFVTLFAIVVPAINGCIFGYLSGFITPDIGNRFMLAILAASASYIAVPAAMRQTIPEADAGLYILMALGITFPFNISLGMPLFFKIIQMFQ